MPELHKTYVDRIHPERFLLVDKVLPGCPKGREVRGTLTHPGHEENGRRYSTDLLTFERVWLP